MKESVLTRRYEKRVLLRYLTRTRQVWGSSALIYFCRQTLAFLFRSKSLVSHLKQQTESDNLSGVVVLVLNHRTESAVASQTTFRERTIFMCLPFLRRRGDSTVQGTLLLFLLVTLVEKILTQKL